MRRHTVLLTSNACSEKYNENYFKLKDSSQLTSDSNKRRFDILASNPVATFKLKNKNSEQDAKAIVELIDQHLSENQSIATEIAHLPFFGGVIGLVSYNYAEQSLGIQREYSLNSPSQIGIYRWAVIVDHKQQQSWLVADAKLSDNDWQALIEPFSGLISAKSPSTDQLKINSHWHTSLDQQSYRERFENTQNYIRAGDCYQLNLTRQFSASYQLTDKKLSDGFETLSRQIQEPFSAYFEFDGGAAFSFSPERFIQITGKDVTTEPIKGTRQRIGDSEKQAGIIKDLENSEKDRAENLMIVDLMRNDLGKHCVTGSVSTPRLFSIASYSNVHHLVSEISGEINDASLLGKLLLFLDCLPGGSITGAPKLRAMQILAELEPHDRACYCGSLFYLSSHGNLDSNILIRSLLFDELKQEVYCWGGGGIVADSECDKEFEESYYKVSHILDALSG